MHIFGGGNIYLDKDMEKQGSSAHFPKRTGCTPWFFRMSAGTKINCAFNNSHPNGEKNEMKQQEFCISKGYILTKGISAISIINAPKLRRSAGNGNSPVMQRFQVRRHH